MKKVISVILALLLALPVCALADVDLTGMSFAELVALRAEVDKALWASDGWQEVDVPVGAYLVGRDIPAGHWTITMAKNSRGFSVVYVCNKLDVTETTFADYSSIISDVAVYGEAGAEVDDATSADVLLSDGQYVVIEYGNVVFSPFTGKALGFK